MEPRTNPYEDQKCEAEEELERKLLAALDDGDSQEVTPEFFKQLRASVAIGREQKDLFTKKFLFLNQGRGCLDKYLAHEAKPPCHQKPLLA
jgi:hypothetical protein